MKVAIVLFSAIVALEAATLKSDDFADVKPGYTRIPELIIKHQHDKISDEPMTFTPRKDYKQDPECGVAGPSRSDDKIVSGNEATPHEYPWQVGLFFKVAGQSGRYFCGGALLTPSVVLTAAHCVDGATEHEVVLGAHNIRNVEDDQTRITSYDSKYHPQWRPSVIQNDVGLVFLPSPVEIDGTNIRTTCLVSPDAGQLVDERVTATGWGRPSDSAGGISDVLKEAENRRVMSNSECRSIFSIVNDGTLCIDTSDNFSGTCNGDSGGPLNWNAGDDDRKFTQVGIVSFGSSAGCELGYPNGFARVTEFLDWISQESGLDLESL